MSLPAGCGAVLGPWTGWGQQNETADGDSAGSESAGGVSRQERRRNDVGWLTSIAHGGRVTVITGDRLQNQFREPVWVPRLGFCPLTGHTKGLLLAFLKGITHREDSFTKCGCQTVHCVGVEQRMTPRHILSVSVERWLHSDLCVWAAVCWSQGMARVYGWGASGNLVRLQGSRGLVRGTNGRQLRPRGNRGRKVSNPVVNESINQCCIGK
jgi:hypothetical protein